MTDIALTTKYVEVSFTMREIQGSSANVDTMTLDDRTVHASHRFYGSLAAEATTAISIPAPPGKSGYPKWIMVSSDQPVRVAYNVTGATTSVPGYCSDVKGDGFYLCSVSNAIETVYITNKSTLTTATVTMACHYVTWT